MTGKVKYINPKTAVNTPHCISRNLAIIANRKQINPAIATIINDSRYLAIIKLFVTIQNNKKIVYLHKRNFEISNSRHADERNTNWSYAMLSRDTKIAS